MNFNISQKIEAIRQKPEHIRMRYVWFCLAFSMVFIFMVWIFSVRENFGLVNFGRSGIPEVESPSLKGDLPSLEKVQGSQKKEISNQ